MSNIKIIHKKAIELFKKRAGEVYGDRLTRIILFGSCARGDEEEGSDVDLLVLLKSIDDFWEEVHRLSDIAYEVAEKMDYQVVLSVIPETEDEFEKVVTPLFLNIKREGILV